MTRPADRAAARRPRRRFSMRPVRSVPPIRSVRTVTAALALALTAALSTGCGSIEGEIRELREDERELMVHIDALTNVRKKLNQLATALRELDKDDSTANEIAVEKARRELEKARDHADSL